QSAAQPFHLYLVPALQSAKSDPGSARLPYRASYFARTHCHSARHPQTLSSQLAVHVTHTVPGRTLPPLCLPFCFFPIDGPCFVSFPGTFSQPPPMPTQFSS